MCEILCIYENQFEAVAARKQELDMKIAACAVKRTQIMAFLHEIKKHNGPLNEFDPLVWQAVIHHAQIEADCTVTFVFRDGSKTTIPIKNGVRGYKKH